MYMRCQRSVSLHTAVVLFAMVGEKHPQWPTLTTPSTQQNETKPPFQTHPATHRRAHIRTHTHTRTHMHAHTYMHAHTCTHTYTLTHTHSKEREKGKGVRTVGVVVVAVAQTPFVVTSSRSLPFAATEGHVDATARVGCPCFNCRCHYTRACGLLAVCGARKGLC